jgi:hypothetical protein
MLVPMKAIMEMKIGSGKQEWNDRRCKVEW